MHFARDVLDRPHSRLVFLLHDQAQSTGVAGYLMHCVGHMNARP
jgi:hypothetical protein